MSAEKLYHEIRWNVVFSNMRQFDSNCPMSAGMRHQGV